VHLSATAGPPMTTGTGAARVVRCPTCSGPAAYCEANPWRPFCSERCRNHDLGAWAAEDYRVAAHPQPDETDPAGTDPGREH
jgi:endogenous inhibitor of DNA gyrase (YacG/DUF329 family)